VSRLQPVTYHLSGINAVPWSPGESSIGRRKGKLFVQVSKNSDLAAFQEAVKEELPLQNENVQMFSGPLAVTFWVWRSTSHRQPADATNIQKALEDALQGVLYENDAANREVRTVLVDQSTTSVSHIAIQIQPYVEPEDVPSAPKPEMPTRFLNIRPEGDYF
jgi:Holliday junction resolvase RusA-like endonuclease